MAGILTAGACLGGCCFGGCFGGLAVKLRGLSSKKEEKQAEREIVQKPPPPCLTKAIKMSLEETGYADAEWLNQMMRMLWPRIDTYLKNLIRDSIEPSINNAMPSMMKGSVKFTKVELGQSATPKFGPLIVRKSHNDSIELQLGCDLTLDVEVTIQAAKIPIGVKTLVFRGVLYNVFAPPSLKPPFFGGLQIYFANPPQVDLNFTGAANVADCPGIKGIIRNSIANAVNKKMVLPHRIAVDMNQDDDVDAIDLQDPEPMGILRFTLLKANNLKATDHNVITGTNSGDPYVVMNVGATPWTSKVVKACLDPVWSEGNVKDIPIFSEHQEMGFTVYDEDWTGDDLMGETKPVSVKKFQKHSGGTAVTTTVKIEPQGNLTFSTQWLVFAAKRSAKLKGANLYLTAKVVTAAGLAENSTPPYVCKVSVADNAVTTQNSFSMNISKPLAEKARMMCLALKKEGLSNRKIADIMDIEEQQVERVIMKEDDPARAAKFSKDVQKKLQATHPFWKESVSLMAEWSEALNSSKVKFEIQSKGKTLYSVSPCTLGEVLALNGEELDGPFDLGNGPTLRASLSARWLDHS
eukprot:TRINITY_DN45553_c0_g1_i1.p1 TRINITY_DN45553_c0_g1~~TRINITY_DN45553_c0_g1_i1.p1  ORF type:complete len:597 (+),score=122.57 TRINITY_DN45553_c0_g1_i1:56-1792(+)